MRTLSTFLSLAAALNTGLFAQKVAEVEPNDSAATAMPITAGMHITASYASTTDEDWFSFSLAAPGQVHLHTVATGTLSLSTSRDNRIAFYDATGATRLAWNDSAVGLMADCGVTLPAGSYTARVGLKTGATAGTYDLDFYVLPVRAIDTHETAEPNGATGTPSPLTLGNTVEGEIQPGAVADEDFWSFTLAARGIVLAATSDDGGVPQLDNLALRFYSGIPNAWTAIGVDATNSQSHRVTTLAHPGLLQAGTYAISVKGGPAAVGTAPWDFVKTGKYSLRTALIELPDANIVYEAAEPNNTPATASSMLAPGDAALGNSTGSLDEDWYMLAVGGPVTIGAMAEGVGATPLAGSNLKLWDANGTTLLGTSSGGGSTSHGRLVYTLERAGVYYLSIYGPTVAVTGDYRLHVGGCLPLFVSASTRVEPASTNACVGSTGLRPMIGCMQGETPAFGSTFITRIERTIPSSFAVGMIGLSNTLASGSIPLPYLLGYGGLDSQSQPTPCFVRVDPVLMIAVLTDASGAGEYSMNFAYSPIGLGLKIFQQALCYDPSLNSLGFSVSNDASYVLGDRPF